MACVALAALCVAWPRPAAAEPADPGAGGGKGEAVLLGSSSMGQAFGRIIGRELERRGYRVRRKAVSAAGLARPDYRDMNGVLESLKIDEETRAVFLYLGMNDAQSLWLRPDEREPGERAFLPWGDKRWSSIYARRVHELVEQVCRRGARHAIVLLPVDVKPVDEKRERLHERLDRVRRLQAIAASRTSCGVAFWTSGDEGRYDHGGQARRARDGFHMSTIGAKLVWGRVRAKALGVIESDDSALEQQELSCAGPGCS